MKIQKQNVRPIGWKQQIISVLGMIFILVTLLIAVRFGMIPAIVFGVAALVASFVAGRKWNI